MALTAAACFCGIFGIATAAIITVIYIVTKTQRKEIAYSSASSVRCNGFEYRYDPKTKSVVESTSRVSNDSQNNLRKRTSNLSSTTDKKSETLSDQNNNAKRKVAKEVQTDSVDFCISPMGVKEKVDKYLNGSIPASNSEFLENPDPQSNLETLSSASFSSLSSLSSEKSTDSCKRASKKKVHKSLKNYLHNMIQTNSDLHSAENSNVSPEHDTLSTSGSWSNISSENSNDEFEKAYKKKVLKKFLKKISKTSRALSDCSDESSSSISGDCEVCLACQKNRVNTRMRPCNHRYVCSDCSKLILRLYKNCKVCQAKIENVVEE